MKSGKKTWKITGLVALSDYSALFQNNSDTMFDAIKFGVGIVTKEEFSSLNAGPACRMITRGNMIKSQRHEKEEKKTVRGSHESISEKMSRWRVLCHSMLNQAIHFTGDDMGSDRSNDHCTSLYCYCDHGICIWNHDQQYDSKGSRSHRNTPCIRLYEKMN